LAFCTFTIRNLQSARIVERLTLRAKTKNTPNDIKQFDSKEEPSKGWGVHGVKDEHCIIFVKPKHEHRLMLTSGTPFKCSVPISTRIAYPLPKPKTSIDKSHLRHHLVSLYLY
jgi:hypothetical protein